MLFENDTARWGAITRRDAAADGHFIYAVKTTGIFCRPNCKARLARRANISFFGNSEEAASAGFRACKRCKPDLQSSHDPQEELGRKAVELIKEKVNEIRLSSCTKGQLDLKNIAKQLGWTTSHFHHVFKSRMGITPKQFARSLQQQSSYSSTTSVPAVSLANDVNGEDGYLSEWDWLAPHEDAWDRLPNEHGVCLDPKQWNDIGLNVEYSLLDSGEEFVDWDSVLCGPAL
jgi:methylphosphotriester-DNA--protein-cysteine methyltransferase